MIRHRSPTITGFSLLFRRPALGLAEISWRWSFGAAAAALLSLSFLEYLDTLPVTGGDRFLLGTGYPVFVMRAMAHILHGSAPRFVAAFIVLAVALSLAWVVVAAWGRAATLKALLDYVRDDEPHTEAAFRLRSLIGLNFFRVGATLAAIVGTAGAALLGSMTSSEKNPSPGSAFLIFLLIVFLTWSAWALINWFLSLAAVFVVAEGEDTFGAIAATADFCRNHFGAVLAASTWFGLAHLGALFVASIAASMPLMVAGVLPKAIVFGGFFLVALLYFVVADWLYMGRLAAYVWIAKGSEPEVVVAVTPPQPPTFTAPPETRVDPDDLILSDIPVS